MHPLRTCRRAHASRVRDGTSPTRTFSSSARDPEPRRTSRACPFVGRSGKLLDRLLAEELGITRDECYIANVVKCRPPENRDPRPDEIAACRPWLAQQVDLIQPKVVVTLGRFAAQLLLETTEGITKLRGRSYPFGDAVLVPTLHPAAALRGGAEPLAQMRADFVRAKLALAGMSSVAVRTAGVEDTQVRGRRRRVACSSRRPHPPRR